eukprot:556625-Pelagomonas_calceolata.AAC.5
MGHGMKESKRALRFSGGNIQTALDFIHTQQAQMKVALDLIYSQQMQTKSTGLHSQPASAEQDSQGVVQQEYERCEGHCASFAHCQRVLDFIKASMHRLREEVRRQSELRQLSRSALMDKGK